MVGCSRQVRSVAAFTLSMKTATSLVAVDRLDKGGCGFYTGYENRIQVAVDRLDKGGCGFYTGYENCNQVDRLDKGGCGFYTGYENLFIFHKYIQSSW